MGRDKRYGAFLLLAAIIFGVFLFRSSSVYSRQENETGPVDSAAPFPETGTAQAHEGSGGGPALTEGASPEHARRLRTKAERAAFFPGFPVNINTASEDELTVLPGVGKKTAARIIEKRRELGGFRRVDELTEVKWIGRVKLEKIRGLVTVGGN